MAAITSAIRTAAINIQAGIFLSYIGLWSYYNFDNWTYQPSYVSSNTPWFFNGVRAQWFPSDKLKIEPWLINGWQSYAKFNSWPGVGGQIRYTPNGNLILVFNQYTLGTDALGVPGRHRYPHRRLGPGQVVREQGQLHLARRDHADGRRGLRAGWRRPVCRRQLDDTLSVLRRVHGVRPRVARREVRDDASAAA